MRTKLNHLLPFKTKKQMPSLLVILLFCFVGLPVSGHAENPQTPAAAAPPVRVQTITVQKTELPSRVEVVGTVQAVNQAVIAAKISGPIVELPVVLGSRIKTGELLVKINAREISARVLQAQAQLAQARRNLQREEKLLKQHASTPETVKSMRDMLAIAQAGYHEAASMLSYTTIKAPFAGVITKKIANIGDLATPGMPLLHLEDDHHLQVVTAIPESSAPAIRLHDRLQISIPTAAKNLTGDVAEISPIIDPRSRTMPIKINLNDSSDLRTGMFARITLPGRSYTTLMVPKAAIVPFGQLKKIFVVDKNRVHLRLVRTGLRKDGRVEILSGLEAGDRIVIRGNRLLRSGQEVHIDN